MQAHPELMVPQTSVPTIKTMSFNIVFASGFAAVPFWRHAGYTATAITPAQSIINVQEYIRFSLAQQLIASVGPLLSFEVTSAVPAITAPSTNLTCLATFRLDESIAQMQPAEVKVISDAFIKSINDLLLPAFNYTDADGVNYGPSAKHQVLNVRKHVKYPELTLTDVNVMETQHVTCPPLTPTLTITKV